MGSPWVNFRLDIWTGVFLLLLSVVTLRLEPLRGPRKQTNHYLLPSGVQRYLLFLPKGFDATLHTKASPGGILHTFAKVCVDRLSPIYHPLFFAIPLSLTLSVFVLRVRRDRMGMAGSQSRAGWSG